MGPDDVGLGSGKSHEKGDGPFSEDFKKLSVIVTIAVSLVALLVIGVIIFIFTTGSQSEPEPLEKTDLQAFEDLKSYMNQSYNPCEDFYMYSCAGWIEKHKLDYNSRNYTDVYYELWKATTTAIRDILESPVESPSSAEKKMRDFYQSCMNITNQNQTNPLLNECVDKTKYYFLPVVTRLFVQKFYLSKEVQVQKLFEEIRSEYKYQISNTPWMHQDVKQLNRRLDIISKTLGYTKNIMNKTNQDSQYQDLEIDSNNYQRNLKNLNQSKLIMSYNSSFSPEEQLVLTPTTHYNKINNIFISAVIAQKPFFDRTYPRLINFARIGSVVGHEFSHVFHEYITNESDHSEKISKQSVDNFNDRKTCIVKKYYLFSSAVGSKTFRENFADIAALQVAFNAYMKKKPNEFEIIPGLETMSQEQLFFVAAAQTNCEGFSDDQAKALFLKDQIMTDPHSPRHERVWGAMCNFKEFIRAFNCSEGTRYNKTDQCQLFN